MRRSERLARAVAVACLSTGVALALHVAGGAALPSAWGVALPAAVAFAVAAQLGAVALSRWRLALVVAFAQVAFHGAFTWGAGGTMAVAMADGAHAAHDPRAFTIAVSGSEGAAHGAHLTPSMIAAHVLAAAATYAVLRHADLMLAAARRWASALVARLDSAPTAVAVPRRGAVVAARAAGLVPSRSVTAHGVRGPPLALI